MPQVNISQAVLALEELRLSLSNAYWEVNKTSQKDTLFDIICSLHEELNELAKLSIEDHSMDYEPISLNFKNTRTKLIALSKKLERWFFRTKTAQQLQTNLEKVQQLLV